MKTHYPRIVKAADQSIPLTLAKICKDPENLYCGSSDAMNYLIEPGHGCGLIQQASCVYSCKDSRYYRNKEMLSVIEDACDMLMRASHPDGTIDFLATNFYTPATFEIQTLCRSYRVFVRYMTGIPEEKRAEEKLRKLIDHLANGCLNGGFHTPNHRWVETGALLMAYNIIGNPEFKRKAERYIMEGIDCDEYGEFSERSMGCYNQVNVNSMVIMAEENDMPELYEYVFRNMDLTFKYLESDGSLFTKNSRRQDVDIEKYFPNYSWYQLYLDVGKKFNNPLFLKYADQIFESSVTGGRGVPGGLWQYLMDPELQTFEPDLRNVEIPTEYHAYYPNSNILRVRKGNFSYTLLSGKPELMYVKFGNKEMFLRMCSSFFAVAQFAPEKLEKTETGYRMTFRGHGEYKGQFSEKPATSNWYQMDHSLRPVIHSCDLDYTLDVTDLEDGVKLTLRVDNTPRVPFKLEFVIPENTRFETEQVIFDTSKGGTITVKSGKARLEDVATGSEVTIDGLFAEHMYHYNMRGSVPQNANSFTLYATDFSPVEREITLRFSGRTRARTLRDEI